MVKKFSVILILALISVSLIWLVPWAYYGLYAINLQPCVGPLLIPPLKVDSYYVTIQEKRIYPGQGYEYQSADSSSITKMRLIFINDQGATFFAFHNDLNGNDFICKSFYPR